MTERWRERESEVRNWEEKLMNVAGLATVQFFPSGAPVFALSHHWYLGVRHQA